jgi:large subunit ribosomal protein L15
METLNQLISTTVKQPKRRGRGYGSGVGGHTTGRGAKGDKVRGKTKITFDGTKIKKGWIKRTPFLRGKHRVLAQKDLYIYNLANLEKMFKTGDVVDIKALAKISGLPEAHLVGKVKILSNGKLTKALNFKGILFSKQAKDLVIAAGCKID